MKILFTSHESQLYGAPRSLLLLIADLSKANECSVITFNDGPLLQALRNIGIDALCLKIRLLARNSGVVSLIYSLMARLFDEVKAVWRLRLRLLQLAPDVIYVNTVARVMPIYVASLLGFRVVIHVREGASYLIPQNPFREWLVRGALSRASMFICVSRATEIVVNKALPGSLAKSRVVYNGINPDEYRRDPDAGKRIRSEFQIPEAAQVVGFVGALIPRKGIDIFLAATREFSSSSMVYFLVVGGDHNRVFESPEGEVREDLSKNVKFAGFQADVKPYLSAMDVFVMASREEPFARINLEAAAMECAIIATAVGGNTEVFVDGESALMIEPGSVEQLTSAIARVLENSTLALRLRFEALERVKNEFSLEACNSKISSYLARYERKQGV